MICILLMSCGPMKNAWLYFHVFYDHSAVRASGPKCVFGASDSLKLNATFLAGLNIFYVLNVFGVI